jgi:sulfoxide reductase heme-binding subunit YedZ
MSIGYKIIDWNLQKKKYDFIMFGCMMLYLALFTGFNAWLQPDMTFETLLIRATGTLAIVMLHIILIIGPLSRFVPQAKILLYNRRHLGVSMFFVAAVHGIFSIIQYHAGGNKNPLVSLFTSNTDYFSFINFPFMILGFSALIILFFMAATSHDFWLNKLTAKTWKKLHMGVYFAYAIIIFHVLLGTLQNDKTLSGYLLLLLGVVSVCGIHILAGIKNRKEEKLFFKRSSDFELVCKVENIEENKAKLFTFKGKSIAIFKYGNKISAVDNFCKHQGGPLSEGKIIDGCITCPWHGWQYKPEDGCSPPPFEEKVPTYETRLEDGYVYINPIPKGEGVFIEPSVIK